MHAPLTVKVMNEAASSSHARRAEGRGASAFIVSDTSRLHSLDPSLLDESSSFWQFDRRWGPQHLLERGRHHVEGRARGADDLALADETVQLVGIMQVHHAHALALEALRIGDAIVAQWIVGAGPHQRPRDSGK